MTLEKLCLDIYAETRQFCSATNIPGMGFEILMGPPFREPPIAFIGYQPGEWKLSPEEARLEGYEDGWVTNCCHYADQTWPLARRLQEMFGPRLLEQCVGLNAIFVRAANIASYNATVPKSVRHSISDFCLPQVQRLLDVIAPKTIFVIGHRTLDLFGGGTPSTTSVKGRHLIKTGTVFGRKALAMIHLTGGRISREDRSTITTALQHELASIAKP
jgi:hypothetical protein